MPLSAEAEERFTRIAREILPFAEHTLVEQGEVEPFGVALARDEQQSIVATRGLELAEDKMQFLIDRLREQAQVGSLISCLIVSDVDVADPTGQRVSALRFTFEDSDGSSIDVFFPYRRPIEAEVELGTSFVAGHAPVVF